jgi:hypothetical protein
VALLGDVPRLTVQHLRLDDLGSTAQAAAAAFDSEVPQECSQAGRQSVSSVMAAVAVGRCTLQFVGTPICYVNRGLHATVAAKFSP